MKLWKKLGELTAAATTLREDETGLFVPNRQASWILSFILLFGFLTFITGYFWGQRKAIERFVNKVEEESFADRISYSLYTMNDRDASEFEAPDAENGTIETEKSQEETVAQSLPVLAQAETKNNIKIAEVPKPQPTVSIQEKKEDIGKIFVAPLAGFGTLHAASTFARRAQKLDPGVKVKTRVSKTPKGKTIAWYQAVTGEFDDREELERIIGQIGIVERIKDIKIIEKRKVVLS
ncbi:MAG: hypothetical protein ACJAZS_000220 [Alteromonas naphthalenivorans]|jgi:hypothetical protein